MSKKNSILDAVSQAVGFTVGDDVYLIPTYGGRPYCGIVKDKIQMIGITSRGIHIKARSHHDHNKTYFIGKSAFLTESDAKNSLECWKE